VKPAKLSAVPDRSKTFTSGEPPAKQIGHRGADEDEAGGDDPSNV